MKNYILFITAGMLLINKPEFRPDLKNIPATHYYETGRSFISGYDDNEYNIEKALFWWELAARHGSARAAEQAADYYYAGDEVDQDYEKAFQLYETALTNGDSPHAFSRLGDCYYYGHGTKQDTELAYHYYMRNLLDAQDCGFDDTLTLEEMDASAETATLKAAHATGARLEPVLIQYWNTGQDPLAVSTRNSPADTADISPALLDELKKVLYLNGNQHADFFLEHKLISNLDKDIFLETAVFEDSEHDFFSWNEHEWWSDFYQYDFNNDGQLEVMNTYLSGAGGMGMTDCHYIFAENEEGLYEQVTGITDYAIYNDLHVIQYEDRCYFTAYPNAQTYDNAAYTLDIGFFDQNNETHRVTLYGSEFQVQQGAHYYNEAYVREHQLDEFITIAQRQAEEAVLATIRLELYSPEEEETVLHIPGGDDAHTPESLGFAADIMNEGTTRYIIRSNRALIDGRYNYRFTGLDILNTEKELTSYAPDERPVGESFGDLKSYGSFYKSVLPVKSRIAQLWTGEHDGLTYTMTLDWHNEDTYTLHIYLIRNDTFIPVSKTLYHHSIARISWH